MERLTADLPGVAGVLKATPEDFQVEEIPAYLPCGEGEHLFLWIEKRLCTTRDAVRALCQALGTREAEAGTAGLKDRQAVTRQWISLPRGEADRALGLELQVGEGQVRVLEARRHKNKLRTGHLRGNRFTITLRETIGGPCRAQAVMARLCAQGMPNRYGEQRFGHDQRNRDDGRRVCLGELRIRDGFRRRLLISAYQSALFNDFLDARMRDRLLTTVLVGDVLQKTDTGGLFYVSTEAEVTDAQERLDRGAVVVTGPMFGGRMMAPPTGSPAAEREAAVLAADRAKSGQAVELHHFQALGGLAEGTRRPLLVPLTTDGEAVTPEESDQAALVLRFALPAGAYATVALDEIMKGGQDLR